MNNDPNSQAYYRYNQDKINTYMGYIGLHSEFDGWTLDNKAYTYGYNHYGFNGEDPNGETPNGTFCSGKGNDCLYPDNVPGQHMRNWYRSWGDIFRLSKEIGPGEDPHRRVVRQSGRHCAGSMNSTIRWTMPATQYDGSADQGQR